MKLKSAETQNQTPHLSSPAWDPTIIAVFREEALLSL